MPAEELTITLSKDEAIVLFEFLARFNDKADDAVFEDQAEQRVLWDIESTLETKLSEPFYPNYASIVQQARTNIRDKE